MGTFHNFNAAVGIGAPVSTARVVRKVLIIWALCAAPAFAACDYIVDTRELDDSYCFSLHAVPALGFLSWIADPGQTENSVRTGNAIVLAELLAYEDCLERVDRQTKPIFK